MTGERGINVYVELYLNLRDAGYDMFDCDVITTSKYVIATNKTPEIDGVNKIAIQAYNADGQFWLIASNNKRILDKYADSVLLKFGDFVRADLIVK